MEDAIAQTMTATWEAIVGTPLTPTEPADLSFKSVVGLIHLTGPEGGSVTLECPNVVARRAAAAMFELPVDKVRPADIEDALGELTNIVGGNLKAMIGGGHHLSLPTVTEGRDFRRIPEARVVSRTCFATDGDRIAVSFYR